MFKIESNDYQSPFHPYSLYMYNEKNEYPSIMSYIYYHLLGNKRHNLEKLFDFYKNNKNYSELQDNFNELFMKYKKQLFKKKIN